MNRIIRKFWFLGGWYYYVDVGTCTIVSLQGITKFQLGQKVKVISYKKSIVLSSIMDGKTIIERNWSRLS